MTGLWIALLAFAVLVGGIMVWRYGGFPCPSWLAPTLENPYVERVAGASTLLERAGIGPGMRVLDAGCGPGRLTIPAARRVGERGRVVALDVQAGMLDRLARRVREAGLPNVEILRARLGEGGLPAEAFDVALLVSVLGEIPLRLTALREIHRSLRPGGRLVITEVLPDPHYQPLARVRALAREAGFEERSLVSGWLSYTLVVERPAFSAGPGEDRSAGTSTPTESTPTRASDSPAGSVALAAALLATVSAVGLGTATVAAGEPALPEWAADALQGRDFAAAYARSHQLVPSWLPGDFDGDGRTDVAVLVELRASGARGIAFLHAGSPRPRIVGAGHEIGNGGDDFSWMDAWNVEPRRAAPGQRGDALLVEKREAASALLYWDGAAYSWLQQGD